MKKPRRSGVGERVRELRQRSGLSARAISTLAGLHGSHLSAIESRLDNIELATLTALARVFGTTIDFLATGAGNPPSNRALRNAITHAQAHTKSVGA